MVMKMAECAALEGVAGFWKSEAGRPAACRLDLVFNEPGEAVEMRADFIVVCHAELYP